VASIGTLTAHIGADTKGLVAGTALAKAQITRFATTGATAMKGLTAAIVSTTGAMVGLAGGAAGLVIFAKIAKTGADFQQTMTTVGGVMRATKGEFAALTEEARKMGATTEFTASQAGEGLKFLGMAGFQASKAITALPGVLDLATAGGIELGRASDIASNALTAMGLPVEELSRVNDVFVGTITRSNTNMEMMAESFKYVAPRAKAFGYSIEETAGLIGMLGNAGIQGSMAGTQLAMAIQKAQEVARKFNLESGDLVDVMDDLTKMGASPADVMKLFGIRAGTAALVIQNATKETKDFQDTLANVGGEAETLADKMRSTLSGSFKTLKSVVESVSLDIFNSFGDGLQGSVQDFTEWIRVNRDNLLTFAEWTKDTFGVVWLIFSDLFSIIGTVAGEIRDLLDDLNAGAADVDAFEARLQDAINTGLQSFRPPDLTQWQSFWGEFVALAKNAWEFIKWAAKSTFTFFFDMARAFFIDFIPWLARHVQIVADIFQAAIFARWEEIPGIIAAGMQNAGTELRKGLDATGAAFESDMKTHWENFVNGMDWSSPAERNLKAWQDRRAALEAAMMGPFQDGRRGAGRSAHRAKKVFTLKTGEDGDATEAVTKSGSSFRRMGDFARTYGQTMTDTARITESALRSMGDAFSQMAETGKIAWGDLARSVAASAARIIYETRVLQPLMGWLFSGGSSAGGGGGGGASFTPSAPVGLDPNMPAFASGGSFSVGGAGGTDSQLVAFRATPGERVTVEPASSRGKAGAGVTIIVQNPIRADEFRRSSSQIAARYETAMRRAMRRTG